jgi:hypothetical protein
MPAEGSVTPLLLVTASARHLRPETRYHCKECPVAVAIQEAVAEQCGVFCQVIAGCFNYSLLPGPTGRQIQGELPPPVREFIEQFDLRGTMQVPGGAWIIQGQDPQGAIVFSRQ